MSDWLEGIAEYIEKRENEPALFVELSEEIGLGLLEAEKLFETAQSMMALIKEKTDHANT